MRQRHDDGDGAEETGTSSAQGETRSRALVDEENADDRAMASTLRPGSFEEYIGQDELISKFRVYVQAAAQRDEALDHVLLHGPPGLGKTTLAQIVANELGVKLHVTSGPAIEHKGVLAGLLTGLSERDVLFIDEIHRLSPTVEESLYSAMEDGRIDLPMGEGSKARTVSFSLPGFTLVGATTRTALLSAPLRDRFHIVEGLDFYADEDLADIVTRAAGVLNIDIEPAAALEIGRRSRGTPRVAIRLTKRVRDFAQVGGHDRLEAEPAAQFLDRMGVDREGLDEVDQRVLDVVITKFDGGPVGIEAIAASLGLPRDTLESVHEPFLLQRGFLVRTPRGRMTTAKAAEHLGLPDPNRAASGKAHQPGSDPDQERLFEE
jgi:Holliday junction DNA helicase RuvB